MNEFYRPFMNDYIYSLGVFILRRGVLCGIVVFYDWNPFRQYVVFLGVNILGFTYEVVYAPLKDTHVRKLNVV